MYIFCSQNTNFYGLLNFPANVEYSRQHIQIILVARVWSKSQLYIVP